MRMKKLSLEMQKIVDFLMNKDYLDIKSAWDGEIKVYEKRKILATLNLPAKYADMKFYELPIEEAQKISDFIDEIRDRALRNSN